jgi:hypothetical protein
MVELWLGAWSEGAAERPWSYEHIHESEMGAMQLGSHQTRLCDSPLILVVLADAKTKPPSAC